MREIVGTRIGPFEVVAPLGAGGMGEVYRARDGRLNRDVALKVLPQLFASDPDRLARFNREAQVLASLNHPNIAAIYGVEEAHGTTALVLELVEGPTLADRIAEGPLPVPEVIAIARQITEALESAHDLGIIHRDLKPANIKLAANDKVKVLDFGLAKLLDTAALTTHQTASSARAFDSPTSTTPPVTMAGVILGTAAYMSPEQTKGQPADKRTDIWAFGCLLFEMLTGRPAFAGDTAAEIIGAVLHQEPRWDALPSPTPIRLRQLLQRCLTRDPARRLRDIADARFDLDDTVLDAMPTRDNDAISARARWLWSAMTFLGGATVAGVFTWLAVAGKSYTPSPVARWTMSLPSEAPLNIGGPWGSLAITRDGRAVAYVAQTSNGRELFLRRADDAAPRLIGGTADVWEAFFSPDGQWIGFISADRLKKVSVTGGQPITIADTMNYHSGVWADDGTIYIAGRAGLAKVSPDGRLTQILKPEPTEGSLAGPDLLPDGSILFTIEPSNVTSFDDARIAVLTREGERRIVLEGGAYARYGWTGHLVYARGGHIMAVPFDLDRFAASGTPAAVIAGGSFDPASGTAYFALSRSGLLVYAPGGPQAKHRSLAWMDRDGTLTALPVPPRFYGEPSLSADGRQLAVTIRAANDDIWTYDIARTTFFRLTFPQGNNQVPIWSRDGRRIVYAVDRQGVRRLVWRPADGSGGEEPLTPAEYFQTPGSWSPDGQLLAYMQDRPDTGSDIFVVPINADRKPRPFLATPVHERMPAFSPDGHWMAYASDETGQFEVFVTPYPGPGRRWQVSQGGGTQPAWRQDGSEITYRQRDRIKAVAMRAGLPVSAPRTLVELPRHVEWVTSSPDAQRFLVIYGDGSDRTANELHVVVNWLEELKQRVQPTQ